MEENTKEIQENRRMKDLPSNTDREGPDK